MQELVGCLVYRLTKIRIGSVINFAVISKISCGRVALTNTTCMYVCESHDCHMTLQDKAPVLLVVRIDTHRKSAPEILRGERRK